LEMGIERAAPDIGPLTDLPDADLVVLFLQHKSDQGRGELASRVYRA
jgi:hypothetical protein